LSGDLGASQLLHTSLYGSWWITEDEDQRYLFEDFPFDGRSRKNMILQGDGVYEPKENSLLYSSEIDLVNIEEATLSYALIYRTEEHWDGLLVFAIQGGINGIRDGRNWVVLSPENGYPGTVLIKGKLFPGYSGITTTWIREKIDLAPVLGKKVILGFYFSSDDFQEDWGAALDDILITSSSAINISQFSQTIDLTELTLELPEQDYLAPIIPRINLTSDTYCEDSTEILKIGQRAFVKGINESETRALVLHPNTKELCWVNLENAWIDGDLSELVRVSDLKPEDYFLPVCAASYTPAIVGENCSELISGSNYQNELHPYQLQQALVEEGRITQVDLFPITDDTSDESMSDPRVSGGDYVKETEILSPPGGVLWINGKDFQAPCYIVKDRTGKITCEGLSFNAAGPLTFDLCWQGFDSLQDCPAGFGSYEGGCIRAAEMTTCELSCPPGYKFYDILEICVLDRAPELLETDPDLCPAGMSVFSELDCCAETRYKTTKLCPEGYYYLADQKICQRLPDNDECPDAYSATSQSGVCFLPSQTSKARCTNIQAEFPIYEISVRESTKCYKNPDNKNEIVSSLRPFSIVKVLGLGENGITLVVENPDYKIPCWADVADFYLEELDLGKLPVITPND
jgi:hypothetical protein